MLWKLRGTRKSLGSHSRPWLAWNWQQGHLNRGHHCALEVWVDVDVLGLLRSHRRRRQHHSRGLHLRGHVHTLRWGRVVRVLQWEQRLWVLLLLEQAPDRLLLL